MIPNDSKDGSNEDDNKDLYTCQPPSVQDVVQMIEHVLDFANVPADVAEKALERSLFFSAGMMLENSSSDAICIPVTYVKSVCYYHGPMRVKDPSKCARCGGGDGCHFCSNAVYEDDE